jgi:phospholipid-binding lipoprotein MlaA
MTPKPTPFIACWLSLLCVLASPLPAAANPTEAAPSAAESTGIPPNASPVDRFESYNRAMYRFNTGIDRAVLRPLAEGYAKLPRPIRGGIGNFIGHLAYADTIVNDFLQGKFVDGGKDLARFTLNTVVGVGGLFDPATVAGLQKNDEDFGQTLGKWGVPAGPYLVLPFLGASTVRDAPTWAVTNLLDGRSYLNQDAANYSLAALHLVDVRAGVLVADASVEQAYDPYAFVRDAYLQRREYKVHDGNVPQAAEEPLEDPAGEQSND